MAQIGEPLREIHVEPLTNPVPQIEREPQPVEVPLPQVPEPEKVPV